MRFQQKSSHKQVLTSKGALETARLLALGSTLLRPITLENLRVFSHGALRLCGRKV